ncbi:benzoate 1,2-dioxygenase electron transfer component BenC [uncultured Methylobacterium sp.]|jgi:benzoate/toluate 1,2-dioxygenase reductase subunit|uniref:benzoate 1,2-dioxygenase electron transfer component BenC n=1 Tax=uncultured Methylobacterium sp. TaxID=157278 RepID=UPI00262326AD|nr:benzoate 1,2-dioxygenase electron transfer component BenC [uncultured Methylobacterium sp.]
MDFRIALNFEDGITRFVECRPGETVADASYRVGINIPLDCRDGACGTCKGFCESGKYDNGSYIDDAMTDEEAAEGYILACQMRPQSDCIVRIAATSNVCKTGVSSYKGKVSRIDHLSDTTTLFSVALDAGSELTFLPGQYVNVVVPDTGGQKRSYSFSSAPHAPEVSFLIRNTPTGLLPTYMRERAQVGAVLEFTGPLGSFYLREVRRSLLFLAGGTGLAPFLAMLEVLAHAGSAHAIHLIYGVTNDADLVLVEELEAFARRLPNFSFQCCVADETASYAHKGYVTRYIAAEHMNAGDVDVYLCGPPAMVDAVRNHMSEQGLSPANFFFEKFANSGVVTAIGAVLS